MPEIDVTVDASEGHQELDVLEQRAMQSAERVLDLAQRSYESVLLMAEISGGVIDMTMAMTIQATIMLARTFSEIAAAETMSGVMAVKAGLSLSAALIMFNTASRLRSQRDEVSNRFNSMIQLARTWIY